MSSDAFENRIHEIDVLLKNEHDQLLKKVYHETFTSVDTIIQNSVNNSKSYIFDEMQLLQDKVLKSINRTDISDISKCTLQMILQKINKFYIDYMSYYSDECFKVIRKKIGN